MYQYYNGKCGKNFQKYIHFFFKTPLNSGYIGYNPYLFFIGYSLQKINVKINSVHNF